MREMKAAKGIADAYDFIAYDRFRYKGATAVTTNTQSLFTVGVGQSQAVANSAGETYIKDRFDTNLQDGNRLPRGNFLVVQSIQAFITISGETDTTYPTSGVGTELPTNPAAAATISGVNLMRAIMDQTYIQFWCGEKAYEEGLVAHFPSEFGISGFAGSGESGNTTAIVGSQTAINNGFGRPRILQVQRLIPELVNFRMDVRHLQAFTATRQFTLGVLLRGVLIRPVQ
jgi:hypothetical protein